MAEGCEGSRGGGMRLLEVPWRLNSSTSMRKECFHVYSSSNHHHTPHLLDHGAGIIVILFNAYQLSTKWDR